MSLEIKDLSGLGQPLTKLVEVISSAIGGIYRPVGIKREARAQAEATRLLGMAQTEVEVDRLKALATAEAKNKQLLSIAEDEIEQRIQARLIHKERQRQENLEAIADSAVSNMPESASETPIDEDWKARFFSIAEDVSNKDMQELWGRVLAGEVAKPGSYSLRSLEILRTVNRSEAEAFQRIRYLALDNGAVIKPKEDDLLNFGVSYEDLLKLREAGLVLDGDMLTMTLTREGNASDYVTFTTNHMTLLCEFPQDSREFKFSIYMLSSVGRELLSLIDPAPNMSYFKKIAIDNKASVKMRWGHIGEAFEKFQELHE